MTLFERIAHLHTYCETQLDKYLLLFVMVKLAVVQGKTVILVNDVVQAYRLKFFFNRFQLKCFVIAPEMPKNQVGSILHFFHIGQFDLVVMLHEGYQSRPELKDISTVINFDMPLKFISYKENAQLVADEDGAVFSLVDPKADAELEAGETIVRRFTAKFGRGDLFQCVPLLWSELVRLKSRVETVLNTLSNKAV